jgi:hypothetical protein
MPSRALGVLNALIADVSFADAAKSALPPPSAAAAPPPPAKPAAAKPAKPVACTDCGPTAPTAAKPDVAKAKAAAAPQAKNAAAKASAAPAPAPVAAPAGDGSSLPATEALYQTDTYLFTCEATVLAVEQGEKGWLVVLDRTCFHPQGGGQPADTGRIESVDGGGAFDVSMVKKDPAGVVRHDGAEQPGFAAGAKVRCAVDGGPRVKNARVHSAGHLIDVAMGQCGITLRPTKGYHFVRHPPSSARTARRVHMLCRHAPHGACACSARVASTARPHRACFLL